MRIITIKPPRTVPSPYSTSSTSAQATPLPRPASFVDEMEGIEQTDPLEARINKFRETLRVKLPDTFSGNRKEFKVFLMQVELY